MIRLVLETQPGHGESADVQRVKCERRCGYPDSNANHKPNTNPKLNANTIPDPNPRTSANNH